MLTGFTNEQIVSLLDNHSLWGKRACREILGRKDEFVPLLLEFLDKIINEKNLYDCSVIDRFFPTSLLLARMRVTEAYPRLISLLSFGDDEIDFIWGDFLFMLAPYILRDTYDENSTLLPALIENRSVSPWARKMAVSAYGVYYKNGYISREEITAFLRHLAYDVYIGQTSYEDRLVLSGICTCVRDQQLEELIDDIKVLYARGDIDKGLYGNFESYLKHYKTPHREKTDCPVDAVKELEEWGWFQEPKDDIDDDDEPYDDEIIGRNAPCPCGSGKKYKHCHGR